MAEHCVNRGRDAWLDCPRPPSVTRDLPIHGSHPDAAQFGHLAVYGADAPRFRR